MRAQVRAMLQLYFLKFCVLHAGTVCVRAMVVLHLIILFVFSSRSCLHCLIVVYIVLFLIQVRVRVVPPLLARPDRVVRGSLRVLRHGGFLHLQRPVLAGDGLARGRTDMVIRWLGLG